MFVLICYKSLSINYTPGNTLSIHMNYLKLSTQQSCWVGTVLWKENLRGEAT